MKRWAIVVLLPMLLLLTACGKDSTCGVPHGVGCVVDLSLPNYYDLWSVGGCMFIKQDDNGLPAGHRGIFVQHTLDGYRAFEATCPKDQETAVEVREGFDNVLQCPVCETIFILDLDGMPYDGAATSCSLYQYGVTLDADGHHLHIY